MSESSRSPDKSDSSRADSGRATMALYWTRRHESLLREAAEAKKFAEEAGAIFTLSHALPKGIAEMIDNQQQPDPALRSAAHEAARREGTTLSTTPQIEPTEPDEIRVVLTRYENAVAKIAQDGEGDEDDDLEMTAARGELMDVLTRALSAASATPRSDIPCPTCGNDFVSGADVRFIDMADYWSEQKMLVLDVMDELDAMRRGVAVTYLAGQDPLRRLRDWMPKRAQLEAGNKIRAKVRMELAASGQIGQNNTADGGKASP